MKNLYIDASFGFTLNRFFAALVASGAKLPLIKKEIKKLALPKKIRIKIFVKKFQNGVLAKFSSSDDAYERSWLEIRKTIEKSKIDARVKRKIMKTYEIIAKAEASVHSTTINTIHFHEIGKWHNLARIAGIFFALKEPGIKKIYCTKVNSGSGFVKTAHGRLAIPTPATNEILISKKIPFYKSRIKKELVTPSSAALLKVIVGEFLPARSFPIALDARCQSFYGYEKGKELPLKLAIKTSIYIH